MKQFVLILLLAASAATTIAQTSAKPANAARPATAKLTATAASAKLPPGVPVVHGIVKTAFSLRYEDIKIGAGIEAEPNKIYKVHYTGWLAADGHKFDSSYDHKAPVMDKDGKPEMGADGQPKMGDPQPISIPQGFGRVIPGFDQGFAGMHIGGKRRLFIPWQLAYGARGRPGPDAAHLGIPPKADLIFDIELVAVEDLQMPQGHPGMGGMPGGHAPIQMPHPGAMPGTPATPGTPAAPATPSSTTTPGTPATPSTPSTPSTPATPPTDKPQTN